MQIDTNSGSEHGDGLDCVNALGWVKQLQQSR